MILEHEIPEKSKLYFGESAKIKRKIENISSEILLNNNYEEIITPTFTYYQSEVIENRRLIHFSDDNNCQMTLRADTTIDVARIITKRLEKQLDFSKIFYIQPVFSYPSTEHYQIGAEHIGETDLVEIIKLNIEILNQLNLKPVLQISNIKIPKLLSQILDIPISNFTNFEFYKFRKLNINWLNKLIYLQTPKEIEEILDTVPEELKQELIILKETSEKIEYQNKVLAPLYYSSSNYYTSLFFRIFENNKIYSKGGRYKIDSKVQKIPESVGFSMFTDQLIDKLSEKK
jgi:ATP phosphoribosyltransferase regulatory subunit HisZ